MVVDDTVIDGLQAGGCQVAEHRRLYRCGLHGQCLEAVAVGMSGQIDQDVDFVGHDALRELCVGHGVAIHPMLAERLDFRRHLI